MGGGGDRTPRTGPPDTTVVFPDPNDPNNGTVRVYGPGGEATTDYDFGHDHGAGDPHAHDWGVDSNGKPIRGKGPPLRPNECSQTPVLSVPPPPSPTTVLGIGLTVLTIIVVALSPIGI